MHTVHVLRSITLWVCVYIYTRTHPNTYEPQCMYTAEVIPDYLHINTHTHTHEPRACTLRGHGIT
jgi:hypothetical protein